MKFFAISRSRALNADTRRTKIRFAGTPVQLDRQRDDQFSWTKSARSCAQPHRITIKFCTVCTISTRKRNVEFATYCSPNPCLPISMLIHLRRAALRMADGELHVTT